MRADILIVGQGLAGTLLAWEFERAGVSFEIADRGHALAATTAAAGIINPVTGRRLVRSAHIETLLPAARAVYRDLETVLGVPLWRGMRVRREFADERERSVARQKHARGELAPFVEALDDAGLWIRGAARVDVQALLAATRARWIAMGRLRGRTVDPAEEADRFAWMIDCRGLAATESGPFGFVPWTYSKGEMLELAVEGLEPDVILNCRQWVLPVGEGNAWVGATHEPGVRDLQVTSAARSSLGAAARELLGPDRPFTIQGQRAGIRVTLPDKHPVAGLHPLEPRRGLINGLGTKGASWAPMLARQWLNHVTAGAPFDAAVDVGRFLLGDRTGAH